MHLIDRRLNTGGKSLQNRQRFLRRAKAIVQRAVQDASGQRSIRDIDAGGHVSIPAEGLEEPHFHHGHGGIRDHVLPGNRRFTVGDLIPRPEGGGAGGGPGSGTDGDGGEDDFTIVLSREEFVEFFLDDLELPDLVKRRVTDATSDGFRRAGFQVTGSPANVVIARSLRNALARRIALSRPTDEVIAVAEAEIERLRREEAPASAIEAAVLRLEDLHRRGRAVPWIDPVDLRFRRFEPQPRPIARAVMFCLMDVSGSMTEHMKDLAKRFYMLLHLFLGRRYERVEVVFIRHTDQAREVDEETFFHSRETGGTRVSTALVEMQRIVKERYSPADWNIYAAQASDGDNMMSDNGTVLALMTEQILPICQYFAYLEVGEWPEQAASRLPASTLWRTLETLLATDLPLVLRKVGHRREIYPVFRDLFSPKVARP